MWTQRVSVCVWTHCALSLLLPCMLLDVAPAIALVRGARPLSADVPPSGLLDWGGRRTGPRDLRVAPAVLRRHRMNVFTWAPEAPEAQKHQACPGRLESVVTAQRQPEEAAQQWNPATRGAVV